MTLLFNSYRNNEKANKIPKCNAQQCQMTQVSVIRGSVIIVELSYIFFPDLNNKSYLNTFPR